MLVISSAVTMAVPFGIGRVIDIIYTKAEEGQMTEHLRQFCKILLAIFLVGAVANFGRVYLMQSSGICTGHDLQWKNPQGRSRLSLNLDRS